MSGGVSTDYAAVAAYLFGLKPHGSKLGIDRMRPLAAALGHPERAMPFVHVAGTNGKGSVAAMIESILRTAGWRVGLYTSPHLVHLGERVQVDRQSLSENAIVAYSQLLDTTADRLAIEGAVEDRSSFFEWMTAMALLEFQARRCDIAVLEVGLGGEFDATNIVDPAVSAITSIGMDHCEWLGDTIEEIAYAKAGIIKEGRPVVMGRLPPAAEMIVRTVAANRNAPLTSVREVYGEAVDAYPRTSLAGDYQRWNAATATIAVQCLDARWRIDSAAVERGLQTVNWSGRWQRTRVGGRLTILDASHNAEGATVLAANLVALQQEIGRAPVVVVGVLGVERAAPLLQVVAAHAKEIYLVVPAQARASSQAELEALIPAGFGGRVIHSPITKLFPGGDRCTAGGPDDVVVVTGSIYLLGEVMSRLETNG